jgi:hypothetical protein
MTALTVPAVATLWSSYYRRWAALSPPLRPNADVRSAIERAVEGHDARMLLLGVTPELASCGLRTVAADVSATSVAHVWPGNVASRSALRADWRELPCRTGAFSAAIGDGSLSCLEYPLGYRRVFGELARVIRGGGKVALRVFLTPDDTESLDDVGRSAMAGRVGSIDALKWRIAHALCASRGMPNVAVQSIWVAFNRLFPDRAALARAAGWSLATTQIDHYADRDDVFSFPTQAQLLASVPTCFTNARIVESGAYELAERCPILVMDVDV